MSRKNYFGTDGIRGRVGVEPITPEFMLKLGRALGHVIAEEDQGRGMVVIGKDTRISGYMFESALEAGLSASGIDIRLLGPMPTPAIAYMTRTMQASAGIVISASHNPYYDNGIKLFSTKGTKLDDRLELMIEQAIDRNMPMVESSQLGKVRRIVDASGRYTEFCKSTFPSESTLKGLKIVLDCAHGATYHIAPAVFKELGATVFVIGDQPDGLNINVDCGSTHLEAVKARVITEQADLGIAFDGDGDRVLMVDHQGSVVDGDQLLFIIASQKRLTKTIEGVVGTLMTNLGMEIALKEMGIGFVRAKVGDRYVIEKMNEHGWRLGGESSGHIICLDQTTTGDGIVSALQVLSAIVESGKSLAELRSGMRLYPQEMINIKMPGRIDIASDPKIQAYVADAENKLANRGRVLLRPSGTEPLVRVMVEADDSTLVNQVVVKLADQVREVVSQSE